MFDSIAGTFTISELFASTNIIIRIFQNIFLCVWTYNYNICCTSVNSPNRFLNTDWTVQEIRSLLKILCRLLAAWASKVVLNGLENIILTFFVNDVACWFLYVLTAKIRLWHLCHEPYSLTTHKKWKQRASLKVYIVISKTITVTQSAMTFRSQAPSNNTHTVQSNT